MDVDGGRRNNDAVLIEYLVEPGGSKDVKQGEANAIEVADCVHGMVDSVADEVIELSDTDQSPSPVKRLSSATGSSKKSKRESDSGDVPIRRRRRVTVEELHAREKRMEARRRLAAQKMQEREALAVEKRRKKEEAQREKERLKREQEEARQRKRREEEERKEQRRKEEAEKKERKRIEEEMRKQKRQKEEEERERKRKEEEEKRERKRKEEEAAQLRKKRESDRFLSFFDIKQKPEKTLKPAPSSVLDVLPFYCKEGVTLAPQFRRDPLSKEIHDNFLDIPPPEESYLSSVKPRIIGKVRLGRAKLFQFHDNWRPPYYGTWKKRSAVITGRRPFAKDGTLLDYEVNSDDEWEIPEDDEDCDTPSGEDEEEDSTGSTDNDGFIVEHGYLSVGEGEDEDDRSAKREDPKERAQRLKAVAADWERRQEARKKRLANPMVPLLYEPNFGSPPELAPPEVKMAKAVFFEYDECDDGGTDDFGNNDDEDGDSDADDGAPNDEDRIGGDGDGGDDDVIVMEE